MRRGLQYRQRWNGIGTKVNEREKTGRKQDGTFEKGHSGNPTGRPKGSFNATTLAAQQLLKGEAETLAQTVIQLALDGDVAALRICLDRILPRRQPSVELDLGQLKDVDDIRVAHERVNAALANGQISASELAPINALLESRMKLFEVIEFEQRLSALEEAVSRANPER